MNSLLESLLDGVKAVAPGLVQFIPGVGPIASMGLKAILKDVTGSEDVDNAAKIISKKPELMAKVKMKSLEVQVELERENTKQLVTVNQTMIAESKSESFAQRMWRPFNGFMFGITLFLDYIGSQFIMLSFSAFSDNPALLDFTFTHVPPSVYMLWSGVLGISAGSRGFEKVKKTKAANGGIVDNPIKTFISGMIGR